MEIQYFSELINNIQRQLMIEKIYNNSLILGIIVRNNYNKEGISFLTSGDGLLEFGYMNHPAGYLVVPHYHLPVRRETFGTQEVILIKSGKVRVDFYAGEHAYLESRELVSGDWIIFLAGGHGIETLEPTVMIEVKNGPYAGTKDKVRFDPKHTKE
jgi:hypothetical protein